MILRMISFVTANVYVPELPELPELLQPSGVLFSFVGGLEPSGTGAVAPGEVLVLGIRFDGSQKDASSLVRRIVL